MAGCTFTFKKYDSLRPKLLKLKVVSLPNFCLAARALDFIFILQLLPKKLFLFGILHPQLCQLSNLILKTFLNRQAAP